MSVAGNRPATSSSERFQGSSYGCHEEPANWYHRVQPAWSLDGRYFLPHEVPLSKIDPVEVRPESDLGGWPRGVAGDQPCRAE